MTEEKEVKKVEPIYEKLAPDEVLIISKEENCITYATNEKGEVVLEGISPSRGLNDGAQILV